jgi:3,4-dihydroxy 2-butanone 4-phosphate synthase/GTP cyclohydrolase II
MKKTSILATIPEAIQELRKGRMVILVDDERRENEGDLILAAEKVTPAAINFMTKFGRGLVCMPMQEEQLQRLQLPQMVEHNRSKFNTQFTISISAVKGVTTGISAADRARTIQVASNPKSTAADISVPGHIFPLRGHSRGVLGRAGHTEGTLELMRLAGLKPAGVLCEVMNDDGSMARGPELQRFAKKHRLKIVSIADIIAYRLRTEKLVAEVSSAKLPLPDHGEFTIKIFENQLDHHEHVALTRGKLKTRKPVLVRLHSECLTGDIFGSLRCDCGWQVDAAMGKIAKEGGVLLYMRQEGRGIGLANKIKAYALQDRGMDTVEANQKLGFSADHRDYSMAAQILKALGVTRVKLLTNNPHKVEGLEHYGIDVVERVSLEMPATNHNRRYLHAKQHKLGHFLTHK